MAHTIIRPPFTIYHYDSISSTNDQLKLMTDAPEFTCVTAEAQTAGRGRRERTWHSMAGEGLYLSVLLRPSLPANQIPLLSLMAAVAVAETILSMTKNSSRTGLHVDIKWPNDVLVNERKLSGILVESTSSSGASPRVIIGIGVNINHQSFPPELSKIATSLAIECGNKFNGELFRDALLDALLIWYEQLRGNGKHRLLKRWQELSSYAYGKQVTVFLNDKELCGVTQGITESGALLVRSNTDEIHTILAGEITGIRKIEEVESVDSGR